MRNMIVGVGVVLNWSVFHTDRRFDNLCGIRLQSQMSCITSGDGIKLWIVNLPNRTGEERRGQTSCDNRDNNFV